MTFNKLSLHQRPLRKCFILTVFLIFCKQKHQIFDQGQVVFVNGNLLILDWLFDSVNFDEFEMNIQIKAHFKRNLITCTFYFTGKRKNAF